MNWQLFPVSEFSRLSAAWDRINAAATRSPILEARFFSELLAVFPPAGQAVVAFNGEPEVATTAVILDRPRFGVWHSYQPSQAPLGAWVTCAGSDSDTEQDTTDGLLAALPFPALLLGISQLDPDMVVRPANGDATRTLDYIETGRVTIAGSFDDYWSARGKNLRHNMKRQRNRLEREEVVATLDVIRSAEEIPAAIADYGKLESKSWKAGGGTAIAPDNDQGRFYTRMMSAYAKTGNATVYRYRYDDATVAVDLCVHNPNSLIILKTTYDESIKTSSPAFLMRQQVFRQLFEQGDMQRIEFYGRAMDWHRKWTDEFRTLYHINRYRHPLLARLHAKR